MLAQEKQILAEPHRLRPVRSRVGTVLLSGASGLLGTALKATLSADGYRVVAHSRTTVADGALAFPLEDIASIEPAVRAHQPDWIIHAAGNTSVDACELDPLGTRRLHVEASAELARAARVHGSRLLYVSTDSVYADESVAPHAETDAIRPLNLYAMTKWQGEVACLDALPTTVVARVNFFGLHPTRRSGLASWIIASLQSGRGLTGFTDVHFNPLLNHDLAEVMAEAIRQDMPGGIYNFGATEGCSKYDFACRLARLLGFADALVRPGLLSDAGLATPRARHTTMDTRKLSAALGREMPTINDGLRRMIDPGVRTI